MGTNSDRNEKLYFMLQTTSCLEGFLLMAGLSKGNIWASCLVVLLLIFCSASETLLLKKEKGIKEVHWTCSNWILLAAGLAFIYANGSLSRIFLLLCMTISLYINLYRTCYYEKISFAYLRNLFGDLPVLVFYYLPAFLRWQEPFESKRKRRSWMVGLICLAIILACVILPLYVAVDVHMGDAIVLCLERMFAVLPFWLICMVLGIIPAMINYSVMRGLLEDIVQKNPERSQPMQEEETEINQDSYLMRENVFRIILWGMIAANIILLGFQVKYLFELQQSLQNMESMHVMQGALPLLIVVSIGVVFVAISGYMVNGAEKQKIRMISLIYILTLAALLLLLIWRYVIKIFRYGIDSTNLFGLLAIMILILALCICMHSISKKEIQVWRKIVLWGTALFILISVFPKEYITAEINVQVFLDKFNNGGIEESVSTEELDLEYLGSLGYDAVPALVKLLSVKMPYSEKKSVGQTVMDKLVEIYYLDLNEDERKQIAEKDVNEGARQLASILMEKPKYQVIGKRKISLQALADSVGISID